MSQWGNQEGRGPPGLAYNRTVDKQSWPEGGPDVAGYSRPGAFPQHQGPLAPTEARFGGAHSANSPFHPAQLPLPPRAANPHFDKEPVHGFSSIHGPGQPYYAPPDFGYRPADNHYPTDNHEAAQLRGTIPAQHQFVQHQHHIRENEQRYQAHHHRTNMSQEARAMDEQPDFNRVDMPQEARVELDHQAHTNHMSIPQRERAQNYPNIATISQDDVMAIMARLERVEQFIAATERNGRNGHPMADDEEADDDDGGMLALAHKRALSHNDGSDTATKRARNAHHNAADEGSRSSARVMADGNVPAFLQQGGAPGFWDFIKRMDCTSDADLLRLKQYVQCRLSCDFPLCTDNVGPKVQYFLQIGGLMGTTVAADPSDGRAQPVSDREVMEDLNILEFVEDSDEKRVGNPAVAADNIDHAVHHPQYLVPLGEVYLVHRSLNKAQGVESTNFFVLMDVTSPHKSLWMVYRYKKLFERKEGNCWERMRANRYRETSFGNTRRDFDTVRLLDNIRNWESPDEDMVKMDRFAEALPQGKNHVLQPVFVTPVLTAVREAIEKGWREALDQE